MTSVEQAVSGLQLYEVIHSQIHKWVTKPAASRRRKSTAVRKLLPSSHEGATVGPLQTEWDPAAAVFTHGAAVKYQLADAFSWRCCGLMVLTLAVMETLGILLRIHAKHTHHNTNVQLAFWMLVLVDVWLVYPLLLLYYVVAAQYAKWLACPDTTHSPTPTQFVGWFVLSWVLGPVGLLAAAVLHWLHVFPAWPTAATASKKSYSDAGSVVLMIVTAFWLQAWTCFADVSGFSGDEVPKEHLPVIFICVGVSSLLASWPVMLSTSTILTTGPAVSIVAVPAQGTSNIDNMEQSLTGQNETPAVVHPRDEELAGDRGLRQPLLREPASADHSGGDPSVQPQAHAQTPPLLSSTYTHVMRVLPDASLPLPATSSEHLQHTATHSAAAVTGNAAAAVLPLLLRRVGQGWQNQVDTCRALVYFDNRQYDCGHSGWMNVPPPGYKTVQGFVSQPMLHKCELKYVVTDGSVREVAAATALFAAAGFVCYVQGVNECAECAARCAELCGARVVIAPVRESLWVHAEGRHAGRSGDDAAGASTLCEVQYEAPRVQETLQPLCTLQQYAAPSVQQTPQALGDVVEVGESQEAEEVNMDEGEGDGMDEDVQVVGEVLNGEGGGDGEEGEVTAEEVQDEGQGQDDVNGNLDAHGERSVQDVLVTEADRAILLDCVPLRSVEQAMAMLQNMKDNPAVLQTFFTEFLPADQREVTESNLKALANMIWDKKGQFEKVMGGILKTK